jgi:putative membrane protein
MQATDLLNNRDRSRENRPPSRALGQAWVKTFLLLALGAYFVYVIASGNLANYINVRFAWLSYVAVALFFLLGLSSAYDLLRPRKEARLEQFSGDLLGTPKTFQRKAQELQVIRGAVSWPVLAIIAIPLILGTLIPSRPLGSAAVGGSISLNAVSAANATTFTTDPLTWNVLDWLRAFHQSDDLTSFNGKQADVVGFVYREAGVPEDQFMLARFTISCCVADAGAIGVPVRWDASGDFPADTWLRITGAWEVGEFRGETVPILNAIDVEQIDQPEHPYLYP